MSSTGIFSVLICKADRIPDNCAVLYSWWWCMSVVIVKRGLVLFIFPVIFFPWHSCVGDTIWFLSNLTGVQILWLRKRFSTNARIYPGSCTPTSATENIAHVVLHLSLYLIFLTRKGVIYIAREAVWDIIICFVLFSLAPLCLCLVGCPARSGMFEVITLTL